MRVFVSLRVLLACALLSAAAESCFAQQPQPRQRAQHPPRPNYEQIIDFHSDITLNQDASLQVTETIAVLAQANQIRHGIYREFPTRYTDAFNNKYVVGFQMLSATRDSVDEPFHVEDYSNGKRIYLGSPATIIARGRHVYTLTYIANREVGFFKDHDELFWNVTGNGWIFDIDHASATVHLPTAIPADQVTLSGFTGFQGSHQEDLVASAENASFEFKANRRLVSRQGLSILLAWPKGFITEPTFSEKVHYFFHDNRDALLLAVGLLIILVYYLITWSVVGRDPARGVIMALYEPPQNLSPAAMRYLERMGFDTKTFAAAILDMAVRGYLTIKQQAGSYTLYLTGKDASILTPDEKQVAEYLFPGRDQIWLHNENHQIIQGAIKALKKWLATAEQKTYFVTNSRYLIAPVVFSALVVLVYLSALGGSRIVMGTFLAFWLSIWTFAVGGLLRNISNTWRTVFLAKSSATDEAVGVGKGLLATVAAIPFLFGELLGLFFLLKLTSLALVLFVIASGALHLLFVYLLKAPTIAGRRLMDQVEGFKMFLGVVDGDRLNRAVPPQQTPAVFEKFLPYALALDVEQDWAEKFSGVLAGAGTAPGTAGQVYYAPSFYSGSSWNGFTGTGFASAFSSSLTSAISSSSAAPGSSGGGGGGSGGGGGGGGGGGW
jgi:uncharacterized membrane protein YgcG